MILPDFHPASYNGIPFSVPSVSRSTQHAIVRYHAPYTSYVKKDDLGLSSEVLNVEAFVWGKDAYQQAEKLREELDKAESGTLQLPAFSKQSVLVVSAEEKHGYAEGLFYVQFSMVFERETQGGELGSIKNTGQRYQGEFLVLEEELIIVYEKIVAESRAEIIEKPLSLDQISDLLKDMQKRLISLLQIMRQPFVAIAKLKSIAGQIGDLLLTPFGEIQAIGYLVSGLLESLAEIPEKTQQQMEQQIQSCKTIFERFERIDKEREPHRYKIEKQLFVQISAAAALNASQIDYQSADAALNIQRDIDALLYQAKHVSSYSLYESLDRLQIAFDVLMQELVFALPTMQKVLLKQNEPLLALLYRLEGQILAPIPNPFFPAEHEVRYVRK